MDEGSAGKEHNAARPLGIRALAVALIGVGLVVGVAVASVAMLGSPRIASYPEGSPEAALQRYVAARAAGDEAAARSQLSSNAQSLYPSNSFSSGDFSVSIDGASRVSQSRVLVYVTVVRSYSKDPAGRIDRYSTQIPMVFEGGGWKLDDVPWTL